MINSETLVIRAFETLIDNNIEIYKDDLELLNELRTNDNLEETKEEIDYILSTYLN